MIREILCRILQSWGMVTHTAPNLISACRAVVTEGPFDVIICNYDLPDGNAYNLVDWIHEQGLKVPTLVPYGTLMPTSAPHHREVKLLAKPFDPVDLRAAIENLTHCRLCGSEHGTRLQQKAKV
jgi:DNA-binding NtrC family response regulator